MTDTTLRRFRPLVWIVIVTVLGVWWGTVAVTVARWLAGGGR